MASRADDEIFVSSSDTVSLGSRRLGFSLSVINCPDLPPATCYLLSTAQDYGETSVEDVDARRLCPANYNVARKCCWFFPSDDSHSADANTKPVCHMKTQHTCRLQAHSVNMEAHGCGHAHTHRHERVCRVPGGSITQW